MTSPLAEPTAADVEQFRAAYAKLNGVGPRSAAHGGELVAQLGERVAALEKARRPRPARRPLGWPAALVLIVIALCVLVGWLGWLSARGLLPV